MLVSWSSQECIVSWSSQEQQIDFKSQEQYWCPHTSSTSFLSSRGQMCRRHCLVPGSQHLKTILLLGYKLAVVIRQHYSCVVTNLLWWPCNINITLAYTYYGDQATLLLCRYKLAAVIRQCRYAYLPLLKPYLDWKYIALWWSMRNCSWSIRINMQYIRQHLLKQGKIFHATLPLKLTSFGSDHLFGIWFIACNIIWTTDGHTRIVCCLDTECL